MYLSSLCKKIVFYGVIMMVRYLFLGLFVVFVGSSLLGMKKKVSTRHCKVEKVFVMPSFVSRTKSDVVKMKKYLTELEILKKSSSTRLKKRLKITLSLDGLGKKMDLGFDKIEEVIEFFVSEIGLGVYDRKRSDKKKRGWF